MNNHHWIPFYTSVSHYKEILFIFEDEISRVFGKDWYRQERYDKIALEADNLFNELSEFDRKISTLKRKNTLTKEDEIEYSKCIEIGSIKFEEYTYIEDKIIALNSIIERKSWTGINKFIP